jgi:hypothetical protein
MSEGLKTKSHLGTNSISFGPVHEVPFDNVATINANTHATTIQARLPLPQDIQVVKVMANVSAISGSPAIQISYGSGTPSKPAALPTAPDLGSPVAAVTTTLFNAPVCVAHADTPQGFVPAVPITVYPQGAPGASAVAGAGAGELTLRVVSGPGDTASNLKVVMLVRDTDPFPNDPNTVAFKDY